jgi:predicted transcriptional regulator
MTTRKKPETLATRRSVSKRTVGFRLDDDAIAALDAYAEEHGIDRSAAVREAIAQLTGHEPAAPAWGWRRGVPNA